MAFALVRWTEEDRVSVIPAGWVVRPSTIDESVLPTQGICYWKKRTSQHNTVILAVSDSKKDLEKRLDDSEEVEVPKQSKRPLQENDRANADSVPLAKKRKEHKESVKMQKAAAIATANEMAKQIFRERNTTDETQKQQETKKLTDKVKELGEKLDDKESAIEAKRVVVLNLEEKVKQLEEENFKLKSELASNKCSTPTTTGDFPVASDLDVRFLERLLQYYTRTTVPVAMKQQSRYSHVSHPSQHAPRSLRDSHMDNNSFDYEDGILSDYGKECFQEVSGTKTTDSVPSYVPEMNESAVRESVRRKPSLNIPSVEDNTDGLRTVTCGKYTYTITARDLQMEQEAFEAGEGKRELVKDFGVCQVC